METHFNPWHESVCTPPLLPLARCHLLPTQFSIQCVSTRGCMGVKKVWDLNPSSLVHCSWLQDQQNHNTNIWEIELIKCGTSTENYFSLELSLSKSFGWLSRKFYIGSLFNDQVSEWRIGLSRNWTYRDTCSLFTLTVFHHWPE